MGWWGVGWEEGGGGRAGRRQLGGVWRIQCKWKDNWLEGSRIAHHALAAARVGASMCCASRLRRVQLYRFNPHRCSAADVSESSTKKVD